MEKCVRSFECRPLISSAFNTECESFSWFSSYHFHLVCLFFLPSVLPRHAMPMGRGERGREAAIRFLWEKPSNAENGGQGSEEERKIAAGVWGKHVPRGTLKKAPLVCKCDFLRLLLLQVRANNWWKCSVVWPVCWRLVNFLGKNAFFLGDVGGQPLSFSVWYDSCSVWILIQKPSLTAVGCVHSAGCASSEVGWSL